jgi:hypothetical protein
MPSQSPPRDTRRFEETARLRVPERRRAGAQLTVDELAKPLVAAVRPTPKFSMTSSALTVPPTATH